MLQKKKLPTDLNQHSKILVDIATGEVIEKTQDIGKNSAAVSLGRLV